MEKDGRQPGRDDVAAAMLQLRKGGGRSLTALAKLTELSTSSLSRFERGEQRVPLRWAGVIDTAYGGNGWLKQAIIKQGQHDWHPGQDGLPQREHLHRWPWDYEGQVWMWIRPVPGRADWTHRVCVRWASWQQSLDLQVAKQGITLTTGRAVDRANPHMGLFVQPDAYVLFGAGPVKDRALRDIRPGWRQGATGWCADQTWLNDCYGR